MDSRLDKWVKSGATIVAIESFFYDERFLEDTPIEGHLFCFHPGTREVIFQGKRYNPGKMVAALRELQHIVTNKSKSG